MPNVSGYLPNMLGPVVIAVGGTAQTARATINFSGATASDDGSTLTIKVSDFAPGVLRISNPAGTFWYTIAGSAIVADRTLTLPLITGADTICVLGLAQTLVAKTLTAPVLTSPVTTGTPKHNATSTTCETNEEQIQTESQVNVRTASDTPALLLDYDTADDRVYVVKGYVVAQSADLTEYAYWNIDAFCKNDSGTLTVETGAPVTEVENNTTTPTLILAANGDDIELTATGVSGVPLRWSGRLFVHEILSVADV